VRSNSRLACFSCARVSSSAAFGGLQLRPRHFEICFEVCVVEPREDLALFDFHSFFDQHFDDLPVTLEDAVDCRRAVT